MSKVTRWAGIAAVTITFAALCNCKDANKGKSCVLAQFGDPIIEDCYGGESYLGDAYDWWYQADLESDNQAYVLFVELYGDWAQGGVVAGTFPLGEGDDANYATCGNCVVLMRCTDAGCTAPDAYFFPASGTLELETLSLAGEGNLRGRLSGVKWVEVFINGETFDSTPVPGGDCVNLGADFTFDAAVEPFFECEDIDFYLPTREVCYGEPSEQQTAYDWLYEVTVDWAGQLYVLNVALFGDFAPGGIITGSHPLGQGDDANFETCAHCVLLYHCTDPSCETFDQVFFPTAGNLELTALPQEGQGHLAGTLSGVHWDEVDIDPETLISTPVFRGDCFDLVADYTLDATVEPFPPEN